jgi:hypothetical protein
VNPRFTVTVLLVAAERLAVTVEEPPASAIGLPVCDSVTVGGALGVSEKSFVCVLVFEMVKVARVCEL